MQWPIHYTSCISASGVFGLMLGSLLCDKFLSISGRIGTIYVANAIIILSVAPQMFLKFWSLALGRFMMGFGGAMCIVATSVFMAETVPASKLSLVATSINTGIVCIFVLSAALQD
jgi:MFS family permease